MRKWSLRTRILLAAFIPSFLAISLIIGFYLTDHFKNLDIAYLEKGDRILNQFLYPARFAILHQNKELLLEITNSKVNDSNIESIAIFDSHGQVLSYRGPDEKPITNSKDYFSQQTNQIRLFSSPIYSSTTSNNSHTIIGTLAFSYSEKPLIVARYQAWLIAFILWASSFILLFILTIVLTEPIRRQLLQLVYFLRESDLEQIYATKYSFTLPELKFIFNKSLQWIEDYHHLKNQFDLAVQEATCDLNESLETLEIQNIEINLNIKDLKTKLAQQMEFIANLSHEIRTPLSSIIGYCHILEESELNHSHQDSINSIKTSSDNLLAIINDILDFSKLEAGKVKIESIAMDLKEIIEETVTTLTPLVHEKILSLLLFFRKMFQE